MNQIELKKLITTILTEAFDACCEGWNFEEGEEDKLRAALFGTEIVQEIADLCQESGVLHAHVEKVAFPSGKDIQITLSVPSNIPTRLVAAELAGADVSISNLYNDMPVLPEETPENPLQEDLEEFLSTMQGELV